ncbi:hypothetical protein ACFL1H_06775 [Nanoarchaeota archaeon]
MKTSLDIAEVARSIELYKLGKFLQQNANKGIIDLEFTREPFLRNRKNINNVVVAFGSYDPLSRAHEALFLKGLNVIREENNLDELLIVTSTSHFEKQVDLQKNSAIYDRVHALEGFASCQGNVSLAFFNNPFFVNLIPSLKEKYGNNTEIHFLVGIDVPMIYYTFLLPIHIVDPFSYLDNGLNADVILHELFKENFIVCERNVKVDQKDEIQDINTLKETYSILKLYSDKIISINLRADYPGLKIPIQKVSSTLIRNKRNEGQKVRNLEAVGISDFVDKRSIYLEKNNKYEAFVCARQRFADENPNVPISNYIDELMVYLYELNNDENLRDTEIKKYMNR